jgi:Phosphotransferase enzyme family
VRALEDIVATALGAKSCKGLVKIRKLAEGASNKVFTSTVRSRRVIVKLPDPVVPPSLATASEVATLEYLRTEFDMPVPRVLAWSSSNDNPTGCEYIVMEEVLGQRLDLVWGTSFRFEEKLAVVNQVHSLQCRFLQNNTHMGGYGSLYFSKDAKAFGFKRQLAVTNENGPTQFCLGPMAHRNFMHRKSVGLESIVVLVSSLSFSE